MTDADRASDAGICAQTLVKFPTDAALSAINLTLHRTPVPRDKVLVVASGQLIDCHRERLHLTVLCGLCRCFVAFGVMRAGSRRGIEARLSAWGFGSSVAQV